VARDGRDSFKKTHKKKNRCFADIANGKLALHTTERSMGAAPTTFLLFFASVFHLSGFR